jgi:hypothetical protein
MLPTFVFSASYGSSVMSYEENFFSSLDLQLKLLGIHWFLDSNVNFAINLISGVVSWSITF